MKKLLGKLYILVALTCAVAIHIHMIIAVTEKNEKIALPKSLAELTSVENDLFSTIADSALILFNQINDNRSDGVERKKALKSIDGAFKKLSPESQQQLQAPIALLKQESASFASHRKPLEKYNSAPAANALKDLTASIQKLTESKSEAVVTQAQNDLLSAISKAEAIKKEATSIINKTRTQLSQGTI